MPKSNRRTKPLVSALFLSVAGCLFPQAAAAQQPQPGSPAVELEARVRELEEVVRRLQTQNPLDSTAPSDPAIPAGPALTLDDGRGAASAAPAEGSKGGGGSGGASEQKTVLAGWEAERGFFLRSADRSYSLRVTGQIQGDYRAFLDGTDTTDIDTFLVRRARLGVEATVFNFYEFRLLPDFSNGQAPGQSAQTRIQDAYLNIHYWDAFQVQTGKFKQPFSFEQLIQDRFVPTLERSLLDQLVPARDVGVMLHGQKLFGDRFDYAVSVSNGEINGDFDTDDRKDVNGRVVVRPFNAAEVWPMLRGLQLGVSGTVGVEQEPINPATLRTPATVPWFQFNAGVRANGLRTRYSPELVYFHGPLGFAAQYLRQEQRIRPTLTGPASAISLDVPFEGFYVLATLLLTGEERTAYSQSIVPLRPFDPRHPWAGPGAWELVVRASRLELGDEVFTPLPVGKATITLADPKRFSSGATELTLGYNWYLNQWVRMQFNWEHAWFDDPVRLGDGPAGLLGHQDTLLTRLQIIF